MFADLVARVDLVHVSKELSTLDETTARVFNKLFAACHEPMPLSINVIKVLNVIKNQMGTDVVTTFSASFVLPEARDLVTKLQEIAPSALEDASLWAC